MKNIPIEAMEGSIDGGLNGPIGKEIYNVVNQNGFIKNGTFNKSDLPNILKLLGQPEVALKIRQAGTNHYNNELFRLYENVANNLNDADSRQQIDDVLTKLDFIKKRGL